MYFIASIALIGSIFAYVLSLPFFLLSYPFPQLLSVGDRILSSGVRVLLQAQPWFRGDVHLTLPLSQDGQSRGRLVVSNHRSHLDAFLLLSHIPGIRILAKKTLFYVPFLGLIMLVTRQIAVPRGRVDAFFAAMEKVRSRLRQGETVHVFPELTRCAPGFEGTMNFSSAPFSIAMQEGAMVVPVVFRGTDRVWPKGRFGLTFQEPIVARSLEPVDARQFQSADQLRNEVRRRIDEALR